MNVWNGSKPRMVVLEALTTYKRVVAWFRTPWRIRSACFSGSVNIHWGLDTRVYERKEELSVVRLVISIDYTTIEGLKWRPFSGVGQEVFPFSELSQKGRSKKKRPGRRGDMVSTISFV
jgi:hypothetical protein